jgi:hypothetical protein
VPTPSRSRELRPCGGHFGGHDAGAGSAPDSGSPVGTSSPSSTPAASATDGPAGSSGPPGGSAPPFGSSPPGSAPETDASCTPGVLPSAPPGSALDACWTCMTRGCMAQLSMCVSDCACNAAIGDMLAHMNRGGPVIGCVGGMPGVGGAAGLAAGLCLTQACLDCGCSGVIVPDTGVGADGGNCTPVGGGGSFGNGQCSSTLNKTCNGTNYQIICSCPDAKCACFGPTSQIIAYSGCPYCPSLGGPLDRAARRPAICLRSAASRSERL